MTGKIMKALLSTLIISVFSVFAAFSASADTADNILSGVVDESLPEDKKISTLDEQNLDSSEQETLPTMKQSYYLSSSSDQNSSAELNGSEPNTQSSSVSQPTTNVPAPVATSKISTFDTPQNTRSTTVDSGVVQTSDSPTSIMILVGLIALTCLVIAVHKKDLVK